MPSSSLDEKKDVGPIPRMGLTSGEKKGTGIFFWKKGIVSFRDITHRKRRLSPFFSTELMSYGITVISPFF